MAGIIQGTFGWDNSPLINGMREAERITSRGASNIQGKITGLFKRDPSQRAERAIGGFVQSLASGDVAGGIQALTGSMSAFGLAAGVALGAGIALFVKFRDQIKATKEAHSVLQLEMINRPLSVVTKFSAEGMDQVLAARDKLATDLREKQKSSLGSELAAGLSATAGTLFGKDISKGEKERIQQQKDLNRLDVERQQIMLAQANAAQRMIDIQQMEIEGDGRLAAHAKARLEKEQAIAELRTKNLTPDAFKIQSGALEQRQGLKDRQIDAEADAKERGLKIEERIAELRRKGLMPDDEKKIRAARELKDLDTQIANETSPQQLRQLKLKRQQKENELRAFGNPNAMAESDNPFAFGTIAARNFDNSKGFGSIEQRNKDANDPNVWGSLGYSAAQRGETPMPKNDPVMVAKEILQENKTTNEIMREAWLQK